jgi:hypothetical protein
MVEFMQKGTTITLEVNCETLQKLCRAIQHRQALRPTQSPIQRSPGSLSQDVKRQGREAATHLHLLLRSKLAELYLHSTMCLHDKVIN